MWSILSTYAVPIIGSAILAAFAKPDKNKPAIWKRVVDSVVVKPSTTNTTTDLLPPEILKDLLDQLLRKPPPVAPNEPLPAPDVLPTSPRALVDFILARLNLSPTTPTTDVDLTSPTNTHGDIASLVACAAAVALAHPDDDITVTIENGDVKVARVKREKVVNAKP